VFSYTKILSAFGGLRQVFCDCIKRRNLSRYLSKKIHDLQLDFKEKDCAEKDFS